MSKKSCRVKKIGPAIASKSAASKFMSKRTKIEALCGGHCGATVAWALPDCLEMPKNSDGHHVLLCVDCGDFCCSVQEGMGLDGFVEKIQFKAVGPARQEFENAVGEMEFQRELGELDEDADDYDEPDPVEFYEDQLD